MPPNIKVALKPNFMSCYLCCFSLSMHLLQSLLKFKIFITGGRKYLKLYIWSKMRSSSLYTMLKPSKTTSPNKLFDYDCVTLYNFVSVSIWKKYLQ